MSNKLDTKIREIKDLGARGSGFTDRHDLDHDRAILWAAQGQMSQRVVERFGHLLSETLKQVAVPGHRLLEGLHHLGVGQVLRRNHVVQVELQRFPLARAAAIGRCAWRRRRSLCRGVDLGSEFLGRGWHGKRLSTSILVD